MKKIFITIILIIILVVSIFEVYINFKYIKRIYYRNTLNFSEGGAIYETPNSQDVIEGNAISNLQKKLPFVTNEFTISSFDYKTAKFQVELKGVTKEKFFDWLKASAFSPIPQKRFNLTP